MPFPGFSESSEPQLARDFVPPTHRDLPMLRLFLPLTSDQGPYRWSAATASGEDLSASSSWEDVSDRFALRGQTLPHSIMPSEGTVDRETETAIGEAVGEVPLSAAWWRGYSDSPSGPLWDQNPDYIIAALKLSRLPRGGRLPEFCWDDDHQFAWGTRVYPDSLVIAAAPLIYRHLSSDPRLDTVAIVPDRDTLPVSSGD